MGRFLWRGQVLLLRLSGGFGLLGPTKNLHSTKPAPASLGLAGGTGQHRPSTALWCAFPHPLQNRVPRVQVLLPLPKKSGIASAIPDFFRLWAECLGNEARLRPAQCVSWGERAPVALCREPTEAAAETSSSLLPHISLPFAPACNRSHPLQHPKRTRFRLFWPKPGAFFSFSLFCGRKIFGLVFVHLAA